MKKPTLLDVLYLLDRRIEAEGYLVRELERRDFAERLDMTVANRSAETRAAREVHRTEKQLLKALVAVTGEELP